VCGRRGRFNFLSQKQRIYTGSEGAGDLVFSRGRPLRLVHFKRFPRRRLLHVPPVVGILAQQTKQHGGLVRTNRAKPGLHDPIRLHRAKLDVAINPNSSPLPPRRKGVGVELGDNALEG
jgi:hypothetical protein